MLSNPHQLLVIAREKSIVAVIFLDIGEGNASAPEGKRATGRAANERPGPSVTGECDQDEVCSTPPAIPCRDVNV